MRSRGTQQLLPSSLLTAMVSGVTGEFDEPQKPESRRGLATCLCDLRHTAESLGASVSSSLKWRWKSGDEN